MLSTEDQVINQILKSENVLLLPSAPADGDSFGSALALWSVLNKLGKRATVVCAEPTPKELQFLPLIDKIQPDLASSNELVLMLDRPVKDIQHDIVDGKVRIRIQPDEAHPISQSDILLQEGGVDYDLLITVDTGDLQQLGKIYEQHPQLFYKIPLVNIDHHASNSEFGTINHIEITASATTQMLLPIIEKLEQQTGQKLIDEDVATLLLAGIITDTGSFQHSNTTPKAFTIAARLLDMGARQQEIIKHVYKTKSLSTLRLWGEVLSRIEFDKDRRFVWSTISQNDLEETGATADESGGIIDELLNNAPGSEVVLLIKERQPGLLSGSLRTTTNEVDASEIAGLFGGGGHKRAAGFRIKGVDFHQGVRQVVETIRNYQAKRLGLATPQPQFVPPAQHEHLDPKTAADAEPRAFYRFEE